MAKSKKFESTSDGPIRVSVPGSPGDGWVEFTPGKMRTYETENPAEIAALEANPDVIEAKKGK